MVMLPLAALALLAAGARASTESDYWSNLDPPTAVPEGLDESHTWPNRYWEYLHVRSTRPPAVTPPRAGTAHHPPQPAPCLAAGPRAVHPRLLRRLRPDGAHDAGLRVQPRRRHRALG